MIALRAGLIGTGRRIVAPLFNQPEGPSRIGRLGPILKINGAAQSRQEIGVPQSVWSSLCGSFVGQNIQNLRKFRYS